MNKKYWFGHSLVWIGVLSNSPDAIAETVSSPTPNATSATQVSLTEGVEPAATTVSPPEAIVSIERSDWIKPSDNKTAASITATEAPATPADENCGNCAPSDQLELAEELEAVEGNQDADSGAAIDPELGRLRLHESELAIEPDPQTEPSQSSQEPDSAANSDPELGRLRLQEREVVSEPVSEPDVDTVFLRGRIDYFTSDNILLSDFDPTSDQFGRAGLSIVAVPQLGSNTQLLASVGGNFAFYNDLSELNYYSLELRAEVRQTIFPNTYATIGWSNRQLFSSADGDRFLNDHAVRFALSRRDSIAEQLTLNSYYQLRFNFTDPIDRSRLTNTIGTSLNYALQPDLDLGLSYQLDLIDFTQRDRNDAYHQVTAQLSYGLTRNSRVSLYGGFSFGGSSDSNINFDGSIVGVSFSTYLPLF